MKKWSYDLPYITEKQKEILKLICKFRFLNRIQIQTLLKHKDYKRINLWLKDLVEKDYLYRIYERKIPLNIQPAIYFTSPTGVRFIRMYLDCESSHKLYREKELSEQFRNKCLDIVNFYIDTVKKTEELNALNFFKTKQDFDEFDELIEPHPDLLVSFTTAPVVIYDFYNKNANLKTTLRKIKLGQKTKGDYIFNMEFIGEKVPRFYLRYRIQQYIEYSDQNGFMRLLFVLPNEMTQKFLLKFVKNKLDETLFEPHIAFSTTTIDQLRTYGMMANIWSGVKS